MARAHEIRREKIRKSKLFNASAVFLQRCYRGYYARNTVWNMREVIRVNKAKDEALRSLLDNKGWWLEKSVQLALPPVKEFGRKR